jgi:hypothetical protein
MNINIEVKHRLQWLATQTPSGNWIGICEPMNLSMEAKSLDELWNIIPETINLLFQDLLGDNELDSFLKERGWRAASIPAKPALKDVEFNVPWELIAEKERDTTRKYC